MRRERFGPLDVDVPVVGIGTWRMEGADRSSAIAAIRRAIDLGMTHLDTAELYADGTVEEIVGEAIAGYRADVFLATKIRPEHATYAGTLLSCEKSLRRLRTDRLDLFLLHWRGSLPLEETVRAFESLKDDGKIRAWGVSNFDVADLERVIEIAGKGAIACNQVLYNLLERDAEHVLQLFCERHRIALVAYSPLAEGRLPSPETASGQLLARIGRRHGATPEAVALAFLLRRKSTFVIPKSARVDHVADLSRAGDVVLTRDEVEAIEEAFPLGPPRSRMPYG